MRWIDRARVAQAAGVEYQARRPNGFRLVTAFRPFDKSDWEIFPGAERGEGERAPMIGSAMIDDERTAIAILDGEGLYLEWDTVDGAAHWWKVPHGLELLAWHAREIRGGVQS